MKTFGISKGQMQRAIVRFKEPPPRQPLTVCFHFPGNFLTHRYVMQIVRAKIQHVDGARIKTIQFVARTGASFW